MKTKKAGRTGRCSSSRARRPNRTNAAGRKLMAVLDELIEAEQNGRTRLTVREIEISEPGEYASADIRALRNRLGLSQRVFAKILGVSPELVEHWEQGIRTPHTLARRLLDRIVADPMGYLSAIMTFAPLQASAG